MPSRKHSTRVFWGRTLGDFTHERTEVSCELSRVFALNRLSPGHSDGVVSHTPAGGRGFTVNRRVNPDQQFLSLRGTGDHPLFVSIRDRSPEPYSTLTLWIRSCLAVPDMTFRTKKKTQCSPFA